MKPWDQVGKRCQRCKTYPPVKGLRFCNRCKVVVQKEMTASGYLTPIPDNEVLKQGTHQEERDRRQRNLNVIQGSPLDDDE